MYEGSNTGLRFPRLPEFQPRDGESGQRDGGDLFDGDHSGLDMNIEEIKADSSWEAPCFKARYASMSSDLGR